MINIVPYESIIKCADRQALNEHRSGMLLFTGLSGSGKSTLAHAVEARLFDMGIRCYVLDGDNIRRGLNSDLTLTPSDRKENIRRIAEVGKLMVDAGLLVFAAFIAPYHESRDFMHRLLSKVPFFEIYVECPLEICVDRDPKGLYRRAKRNEVTNMTGISSPYEEPKNPDLVVRTDLYTVDECVDQVIRFIATKELVSAPAR